MRRLLIVVLCLSLIPFLSACRRETDPPPRYMASGDKDMIPINIDGRLGDGSVKGSVSGGVANREPAESDEPPLEEESGIDDSTAEAVVDSYVQFINAGQLEKVAELVLPEQRRLLEEAVRLKQAWGELSSVLDEKFPGHSIPTARMMAKSTEDSCAVIDVVVDADNAAEAEATLEVEQGSQKKTVVARVQQLDGHWRVEDPGVKMTSAQGVTPEALAKVGDQIYDLVVRVEDGKIPDQETAIKEIQKLFDSMRGGGAPGAEEGGANYDSAIPEGSDQEAMDGGPQSASKNNNPGKSPVAVVDPSTLTSKIVCGYQGWYACPADGTGVGWRHWVNGSDKTGGPGPGGYGVDLWPNLSEFDRDELYPAPNVKLLDGSPGYVFSSANPKTVMRHFQWMAEYGIDGAFLQRFISDVKEPVLFDELNLVLDNVRKAANAHGRVFIVEYDITGMKWENLYEALTTDWKYLVDKTGLTRDPRYLHHQGKPVVAIWGLGFHNRDLSPELAKRIIDFFKNDPTYGGNCCIGGVPSYWRTFGPDSTRNPAWAEVFRSWDVIHPWTVGRYQTVKHVRSFAEKQVVPDIKEAKKRGIGYLPVVWPGFSWDNLKKLPPGKSIIPRLGGRFLWEQIYAYQKAGAEMMFVAMFDELDEATAIFKVTDNHPATDHFLTLEGLPSDWYLRLVGAAGRMLRGEIPLTAEIPIKPTDSDK